MSKHLRGCKRLQVIQKWINGVEDPVWDVMPCRTEGKYIVRPRKEPLTKIEYEEKQTTEEQEQEVAEEQPECLSVAKPECLSVAKPECVSETKQINKPEKFSKPKPIKKQINKPESNIQPRNEYDPTINIEILNQLKLLGEEIKSKREKKEQKRMIKEVVHKQLTKPRREINYNYTEPEYIQQPNIPDEEPQQKNESAALSVANPISYRRRNNIFSDIL